MALCTKMWNSKWISLVSKHNLNYAQIASSEVRFYSQNKRRVDRHDNAKKIAKPTFSEKFDSYAASLASKGFLRSYKPYDPPANVSEQISTICKEFNVPSDKTYKFANATEKYNVLNKCGVILKKSVPNSILHDINSIGDALEFYSTPVNTTVPYDAMKSQALPENLHIQSDYVRFHPDTDTRFNGKTAFPKSSTLVTGLKYRKKYSNYEAKRSFP